MFSNVTTKFQKIERIIQLVVVFALFAIVFGKAIFSLSPVGFLYVYGIAVTLTVGVIFFIAFYLYQDPYILAKAVPKEILAPEPFVTCMVAVRNEEHNIRKCIDSLLGQSYQKREIIIVNDASTDRTLDVLKMYKRKRRVIVLNLKKNVGKKRALGKAMARAKGSIFAFSDSDSVWAPDALEKMVLIFRAFPNIGAVSGHCRALNGDTNILTKIQDSWYEGQYAIRKAFESFFTAVTCVSGPFAVFRKEAILNFVPAWEHDTFLRQEFKFATDRTLTGFVLGSMSVGPAIKRKYKDAPLVALYDYPCRDWGVVYSKAARAWTIVPETFQKMLRQQVRWKKSFVRSMFFTGTFYWKKPLPVALVYYLHIIFVFIGPFIVFRHLIYIPFTEGDYFSFVLYLSGILFVGFMFGVAYKLENKNCRKWIYRPLMSLLSTIIFSWLIFYSIATIRRMTWSRG